MRGAFGALASAREDPVQEMGADVADSVLAEALVTLELDPYPRRVLVAGRAGH